MTVGQLLASIDSRELTEWMAFEQAYGPVDDGYANDTLAAIHEQLQSIAVMVGAQLEDNPAPEPRHYPRPVEVFTYRDDKRQRGRKRSSAPLGEDVKGDADALNAYFDVIEAAEGSNTQS